MLEIALAVSDENGVYLGFDTVGHKDATRWGVYSHTPSVGKLFKDHFGARTTAPAPATMSWSAGSDPGEAQRVSGAAGGLPGGGAASFEPETLTTGESSALTARVPRRVRTRSL
ncbi:hypothetical protein [Streptomyces rubrogriseus]|uniref:hypothetical protein n=1 Tax=Streptomyces rubrogriseus TaxID=194673 RepID=UPI0037D2BBD7